VEHVKVSDGFIRASPSLKAHLFPATSTAGTDYTLRPPFGRRVWSLRVLVYIHTRFSWRLALAHSQPYFRGAYLLVYAIGDLLHLDERGDGFEERLVVRKGVARRHDEPREGDAELGGDLGDLCRDRRLGVRKAEGPEVRRLVRRFGRGGARRRRAVRALDAVQRV